MPEFFDDPEHTPDPAAFRMGVEREARRRHTRRVMVTSASAAVVLVAAGVGVGLAVAGSGPSHSTGPVGIADQPTAEPTSPAPTVDSSSPSAAPTPTPTPTPSVTASSTPVADTSVKVYGDCRTPVVEPPYISEACADWGAGVQDIQWSTWTSERATGIGTYWYKKCVPSCAQGGIGYVANTSVTLTKPKRGAGGVMVFTVITTDVPGYPADAWQNRPEPLPTQPT